MNYNTLQPNKFKFKLTRTPHLEFFVTGISLPGLNLQAVNMPTPFVNYKEAGDHVEFDTFSITFAIDEDMESWFEIYDWMIALGFPENFDQYKAVKDKKYDPDGLYSDASLTILTSHNNPNINFIFTDVFPVSLSGTDLNIEVNDVQKPTATVTFEYTTMKIERVK